MPKTAPTTYFRPRADDGTYVTWEPTDYPKASNQDGTHICPISEPHRQHCWEIVYQHTGTVMYTCVGVGYQS